jgi:hypothetical protein
MTRRRQVAWILMLAADVGLFAWGAMAALAPEHLAGPNGAPILPAGYEGYAKSSWQALVASAAPTAGYIAVLFRVYAAYVVAFGVLAAVVAATAFRRGEPWAWWALLVTNPLAYGSAMAYDWTVGAIGPFELSEYLGLAAVLAALAITAPFSNREEAPWPRSSSAHT